MGLSIFDSQVGVPDGFTKTPREIDKGCDIRIQKNSAHLLIFPVSDGHTQKDFESILQIVAWSKARKIWTNKHHWRLSASTHHLRVRAMFSLYTSKKLRGFDMFWLWKENVVVNLARAKHVLEYFTILRKAAIQNKKRGICSKSQKEYGSARWNLGDLFKPATKDPRPQRLDRWWNQKYLKDWVLSTGWNAFNLDSTGFVWSVSWAFKDFVCPTSDTAKVQQGSVFPRPWGIHKVAQMDQLACQWTRLPQDLHGTWEKNTWLVGVLCAYASMHIFISIHGHIIGLRNNVYSAVLHCFDIRFFQLCFCYNWKRKTPLTHGSLASSLAWSIIFAAVTYWLPGPVILCTCHTTQVWEAQSKRRTWSMRSAHYSAHVPTSISQHSWCISIRVNRFPDPKVMHHEMAPPKVYEANLRSY